MALFKSQLTGSPTHKNGCNEHVALVCKAPGFFDGVVKACIKPYSKRTDDLAESRNAEIRQLAAYLWENVAPLTGSWFALNRAS